MKNASHILASLRQKPSFSKLARVECIRRIKGLFPPRLQAMIRYGYMHNGTLFFVLNHPGAKQEFDNIIASIKAPLKRYAPAECTENMPQDIRAFVKHDPSKHLQSDAASFRRHSDAHYRERAFGTFDIVQSHPQIRAVLERIRQSLHDRTDS